MPMSKTVLAAAIIAKLKVRNPDMDEASSTPFWEDIAGEIIDHIKNNAVITATGVDPQGGSVSSTGTVSG